MPASLVSLLGSSFLGTNTPAFSAKNELTNRACWAKLKVRSVDIDASSAVTSNPIHTESNAEDSTVGALLEEDVKTLKIYQPSRMRISAFTESLSDLNEVISLFYDQQATLSVSSKGIAAANMAVMSVDIVQVPDVLSAMDVTIELEQTLPPAVQSEFDPGQDSDESAFGVSIQNPPTTSLSVSSLVNKISSVF